MAVQISFAQPFYFNGDSLSSVTISTSYFDLLRSKNPTSKTTSFLQKTSAQFEGNFGRNKLFFSLETEVNNLKIENNVTKIEFNMGQKIKRVTADYELSFEPFFTEVFLRGNQIGGLTSFDYGGSFGFRNTSHWFEKFRVGYYAYSFPWILDLKYEDSKIDINNLTHFSKIFYSVGFHPTKNNRFTFRYEEYLSANNKNENPVFVVKDVTNGSIAQVAFTNISTPIKIDLNFSHGEGESLPELFYSQNSFSSNSLSNVLFNKVRLSSSESEQHPWLPAVSIAYDFYKGYLVGNIQSWPFTSVITSLIANRLNYRLGGQLYIFSIETKKQFTFSKISVQPEISFYQILPEVTLDTWQPSYLVFGIKDFTRNILPIRKALLGKIAFSASYDVDSYSFILEIGQYIPLKIFKKELPAAEAVPGIVIAQAKPGKVDGGRWVIFRLRASF